MQNASSEVTLGSGDIGIFLGNRDPGVNISAFGPSGSLVKDYGAYFWVKFTGSGTPTFTTDAFSNTSIAAGGLEG